MMLLRYDAMNIFHACLQDRVSNDLPLPQNMVDHERMMESGNEAMMAIYQYV